MTENTDPNGSMTNEDLELIEQMNEEYFLYAEDRLDDYPAPKWWVADPFYDDVD